MRPAPAKQGTRIEVTDLFSTPARLKFMKTDRAEAQAVAETIKRLALRRTRTCALRLLVSISQPSICPQRATIAMRFCAGFAHYGRDFAPIACHDAEREGVRIEGFAGLPTYHRGTAAHIHATVNGRPVCIKLSWAPCAALTWTFCLVIAIQR